ncbi:MAG: hypothetical protein JST91_03870 [Actinobacteria bacterium]|nr:hypothetical protein [Actinomycetota bacterium]
MAAVSVRSADIPVQRRDRPWLGDYVTVLCGPLPMPGIDALRAAVEALAQRNPASRLTWRLAPSGVSWRNDRRAEDIVVERHWDANVDAGTVLDDMARDDSLSPPLTLVRYPDYIGLKMSHGVGDGRLFLSIISAVLRTAMSGEVCDWLPEPARRSPLGQAALATFIRHPALIRRAMADRVADTGDERQAPPDLRSWTPSRRTVHVALPRAEADEVIAWGKAFAPGASRFALQVSLILRAMNRVGLEVAADTRVIVDLRRYLGWRYVDGNFVAGVPMRLRPGMRPEELSATIKATMSSGRPLANQIATAVRQGALLRMEPPSSFDRNALPRATFTNMGRSPEIECLPFRTDLPAVYTGSVPPEGPLGITFLLGESPQIMSLNATFHDNVVDPELILAALTCARSDPVGLLNESLARAD